MPKIKKSINYIENLSDEIFYEIFDYLDGYDIYQAFSNLNNRFENLLISSSFLMKIRISSSKILDSRYKHFVDSNKHRIISLRFFNDSNVDDFITFYTIDSSFLHLQSLVLKSISTHGLIELLFNLNSLPQLFLLTIYLVFCFHNLGSIYHIIFQLPALQYFKFQISEFEQLEINIRIAANDHCFSLKYLVVNHPCTLNQLTDLLSYTPNLSHLYCYDAIKSDADIKSEIPSVFDISFREFEDFLLKLCPQLVLLSVTINCSDKDYLDSYRWERLISQKMTSLNKFFFSYTDNIHGITSSHLLLNGFTSSTNHRFGTFTRR